VRVDSTAPTSGTRSEKVWEPLKRNRRTKVGTTKNTFLRGVYFHAFQTNGHIRHTSVGSQKLRWPTAPRSLNPSLPTSLSVTALYVLRAILKCSLSNREFLRVFQQGQKSELSLKYNSRGGHEASTGSNKLKINICRYVDSSRRNKQTKSRICHAI